MSVVPEPLRRFGRRVRAIAVVPTRRLAVVAALLAPLWLLSTLPAVRWLPVMALAVLAIAVVLDIAFLPAARDATVDRMLEPTVGVGDETELRYRVTSGWGRPLGVSLHDALPASYLSGGVDSEEHPLPPRGTLELVGSVTGMARGEAELGDVALRVRSRLGLVARTLRYQPGDTVLVAPS